MKKIKCKVCGHEFIPFKSNHYISRDNDVVPNITTAFKTNEEVNLFDTFDCPMCGCQNTVGIRKRNYLQSTCNYIGDKDWCNDNERNCEGHEYT